MPSERLKQELVEFYRKEISKILNQQPLNLKVHTTRAGTQYIDPKDFAEDEFKKELLQLIKENAQRNSRLHREE